MNPETGSGPTQIPEPEKNTTNESVQKIGAVAKAIRALIEQGDAIGRRKIQSATNAKTQHFAEMEHYSTKERMSKFYEAFVKLKVNLLDAKSQDKQQILINQFVRALMEYVGYCPQSDQEKQELLAKGVEILEKLYNFLGIPLPQHFVILQAIARGEIDSNMHMHLMLLSADALTRDNTIS